jgi:hypothetical protein
VLGAGVASYSGAGGTLWQAGTWTKVSKEQVTAELRAGRIRVLVCTDAASEGLNLQAAGALINSDLPWNPSKVEQRIGRIDRIGQSLEELPIVNLYLKGSIDQRVYRALHERCHLFERFVGPMQPVLSRALRMLMGRDHFDEDELAQTAASIENDPTVMQAFPDDEAVAIPPADPLVRPDDAEFLLAALDGTGITVGAETKSRHIIGSGPLRIVTDPNAVADHPDASCVDGLDQRQWALLRQLQRPGERLPLVIAGAEEDAFRVILCAWVGKDDVIKVGSLAQVKALAAAWNGEEPVSVIWNHARIELEERARAIAQSRSTISKSVICRILEEQRAAARLRLIEELGRTLVCLGPESDDLNAKFHRLMADRSATAARLTRVYHRLGDYPEWDQRHLSDLRDYGANLKPAELNARRTGRELDAALDDPRWSVGVHG